MGADAFVADWLQLGIQDIQTITTSDENRDFGEKR